jgi:hypothetical protein
MEDNSSISAEELFHATVFQENGGSFHGRKESISSGANIGASYCSHHNPLWGYTGATVIHPYGGN